MNATRIISVLSIMIWASLCLSQETVWYKPSQNIAGLPPMFSFSGQGWNHSELEGPYQRLPVSAKEDVRDEVWKLSRFSTGITISFATEASNIYVRYGVEEFVQKPHRSQTGLCGIDLYVSQNNALSWCRGRYQFGDTISYDFTGLNLNNIDNTKTNYQLFLPMSCAIKWLEIGIPENASIMGFDRYVKPPIVIYGTSIVQGSAASRPGMSWTAMLQRNLDTEIINLGLAGNGRLEDEVVNRISEIKASVYIIDCLPNVLGLPNDELYNRFESTIKILKKSHPKTPILLIEHPGFPNEQGVKSSSKRVNNILDAVYKSYAKNNSVGIYKLSKDEIGLCNDCSVEGIHPNDLGMFRYAEAVSKKVNVILGNDRVD